MLKSQILFLSILPFLLVACSSGSNSTTTTTTPSLLQGQFRLEQNSVPRCAGVRLEAQFNASTFPKRVQYRLDFGSGEKPITTTEEKSLFKYTSSGKYIIKAEALLDGQVQYQQSLEVNVTSGGACTYIVLFNKEPVSTKQRSQTLEARIARTLRSSGGIRLYTFQQVFQGYAAQLEPNEVDSTAKASDVEAVFLDSVGESSEVQNTPPNWGLDRIDQADLPLNSTYNYTGTGKGVDVYIMDSGISANHQDFGGRVQTGYAPEGLSTRNANQDCAGHGTHVAGLVGGKNYGVAKEVNLIPIRVMNCGNTFDAADAYAGIQWVMNHKRSDRTSILQMSLNIQPGQVNISSASQELMNTAISNAIKQGIVVIASAGNSNGSDKNACDYAPSSVPDVIVVGNSTQEDRPAEDSTQGLCIDLFAPGENIISADSANPTGGISKHGTSMSAPFVSGAAALYLETHPKASPSEVQSYLVNTAWQGKLRGLDIGTPNRLLNVLGQTQASIKVTLEPSSITLTPGQKQTFTATVSGAVNRAVNWDFSGGGSSAGGSTFDLVAPTTEGSYTLKATSQADSSMTATATVQVKKSTVNPKLNMSMKKSLEDRIVKGGSGMFNLLVTNTLDPVTSGPIKVTDFLGGSGMSLDVAAATATNKPTWDCSASSASQLSCTYVGNFPIATGATFTLKAPVITTANVTSTQNCATVSLQNDNIPNDDTGCTIIVYQEIIPFPT